VGLGVDGFSKGPKTPFFVIPAKAGIQCFQVVVNCLDPGFHGVTTFNKAISFDGLVKSQTEHFRSWFDTSPRTEKQALSVALERSP
jgi:hypothetical protein